MSAIGAQKLILDARLLLPLDDAQHLDVSQWPDRRPTREQDDADRAKCPADQLCRVVPHTMDADAVRWMELVDAYVLQYRHLQFRDDPDRIAKFALQVAELLYKNRQFDANPADKQHTPQFWSARERLLWILREFPNTPLAPAAFKDAMSSFLIEHDFAAVEKLRALAPPPEPLEHPWVRERTLGELAKDAGQQLAQGDAVLAAAEHESTPKAAAKLRAQAHERYRSAGTKWFDLRRQVIDAPRRKAACMNAARAFVRGEAWADAEAALQEFDQMLRRKAKLDPKERERDLQRLLEIRELRAAIQAGLTAPKPPPAPAPQKSPAD